jgi:acetylcholinesterase
MSIATHMVLNGGDTEGLFHAAIMMSGGPGRFQDYHRGQEYFDQYAEDIGCSTATDKIACIREAPYDQAYAAVQAQPNFFSYNSTLVPWYSRADRTFLKDSPHKLKRETGIADIPFIIDDMKDEGTLFSLVNQFSVTTDAEFKRYFQEVFFTNATQEQVDQLCDMYSEDLAEGSPFDTGDANALTPQYKRLAALTGDCTFQSCRRDLLNLFASKRKAWSYQIEDSLPVLGQVPLLNSLGLANLPVLGSFHVSDVTLYAFGTVPATLSQNTLNLMSTIISFATTHDPNNHGLGLPYWPQYNTANRTLFRYKEDGPDLIPDTYREEAFDFQNENGDAFAF